MTSSYAFSPKLRGVGFVGNYLPRKCGIATFTHDLSEAVAGISSPEQQVAVCAINDIEGGYDYPDRVKFEIRQDFPGDYSRAADFLNFGTFDVVSLQHEYGIFGGNYGSHVITLLRELKRPLITTCHTVLKDPLPEQREIFTEIAALSRKLVVMSKRAFEFLEEVYKVPRDKIAYIPHGIHDVPFIDPSYFKDKFGVEGRRVLLTFGLLAPNKGIENVIEAMPQIVAKYPKTTYLVLGATHPAIVKKEGESYRFGLQRQVRELGLEEHVLFLPKFVELNALLEYIGASDIFVTPYYNLDQITSGVLSYAMGAGKAVISTPYWHAEELLADGRGALVPVKDPTSIAKEVLRLLGDEVELSNMRKRAYMYSREMVWSSVAHNYMELFEYVRSRSERTVALRPAVKSPLTVADLPAPKIDHLVRLCDDTGLAHHAARKLPNWDYGYWLEDAAGGLVASSKYFDVLGTPSAARIAERCLSLIQLMIKDETHIIGQLDYSRNAIRPAGEAEIGRAIWATGYAVNHGPAQIRELAHDLFNLLVPSVALQDPRAISYATLGAADYYSRFTGASAIRRYLHVHATKVAEFCDNDRWTSNWPGQDLGLPIQALAVAGRILSDQPFSTLASNHGISLLEFTDNGTKFEAPPLTHEGEETPVFTMSFIEALGAIYQTSFDANLLEPIRSAAYWFLGGNRRGEAPYDFASGGCHDALTAGGLNLNQGTDASLACLISFLTLHHLIGVESGAHHGSETPTPNLH